MVELTIGLMIGLLRRIPWSDRQLHAGEWPLFVGDDCHGKTLGILGFGRIGSGTGRVAQALGMQVVAWGPTLTEERAQAGGARFLPLDDVLRAADVLSIHLRLSPESTGLSAASGWRCSAVVVLDQYGARGDRGRGARW